MGVYLHVDLPGWKFKVTFEDGRSQWLSIPDDREDLATGRKVMRCFGIDLPAELFMALDTEIWIDPAMSSLMFGKPN